MAVVDPDSVEVVDFATVQDNAQKKGMIINKSADGPPYRLSQGQTVVLESNSLVDIQAAIDGNTVARIGDVFYDDDVGAMIMESSGAFPLQESDMPGAVALNQYLYTATSKWNDLDAIDNFDDLVQNWTRRERMTEPTSPAPYAYTPTSEQYTMKLITEGKMDEALAFNNMMREFTEERMTEEEMSQRAASLARTPEEYRAWMDAMLGDREPVSEDVGQRRTIADQERTRNEMLEKTAGMTLEEMRQADPFTLLPSQLEAAGMTENGVLKPEYATPFDPDQIPDVVQAWMDKTFPEWRKYPRATTGDTKSATAGMLLDRADEGEGVDRGLLPISSLGSSGMGDTPLERMKAIADSGLSREEIAKLLENRIALAEAERLGQSWTPDTSEQYRTITPSWGGDPVAHKGVFPIPRQTRGPILEEEFGGSAGYELALEAARRAEILGRAGALMKHTGKTGKIGMSRFRTTPEERAFIESTGGIEAYGEAVPSYSGRVEYVPTTDTYLLDEGDQVIPTPEKTKQKPIKSLQQGTNYVGQSGPYGLHAGEIVQKQLNPYEDYGTDIFSSDYYRRRKNKEGSWGINQKPSSSPVEDLLLGQDRSRHQFESMRGPGYDPYEDFGGGETVPMHTRRPAVTKDKFERDAPGYIPMGPTIEGGGQMFQGSMWKPYDYQYDRKTGEMTKVGGTQGRLNELISTGIFGAGPLMRKKALALAAQFDQAQTEAAAEAQKRFKSGGKGARMYG